MGGCERCQAHAPARCVGVELRPQGVEPFDEPGLEPGRGRSWASRLERLLDPVLGEQRNHLLAHPRAREQADAGNSLPREPRRLLVHPEAEPALVPDRPEDPRRVVDKRLLVQDADRLVLEVGAAAVRVDQPAEVAPRATPPWR